MGSAAVRRHEPPPHTIEHRWWTRLRACRCSKLILLGFCNRFTTTCTCENRATPGLDRHACACARCPMGSHPSDGAGHVALDGAARASADLPHALRRIRWSAGAPRILGALDRIRALEVRLSLAALSSADEKSGAASDTQFARRQRRSASSAARIMSTAGPSRRAIS